MHKLECIILLFTGIIKTLSIVSPLTETSRCDNAFIYKLSQISVVCYPCKFVENEGRRAKTEPGS